MIRGQYTEQEKSLQNSVRQLIYLLKKKFDLIGEIKVCYLVYHIYLEIPKQGIPEDGSEPTNILATNYLKSLGVNPDHISNVPHPKFSFWSSTGIRMDKEKCQEIVNHLSLLKDSEPKLRKFPGCT